MAELDALRAIRAELADLMRRVDDRLADEERRASLHPDEVSMRRLENAPKLGRNLAMSEDFASLDAERQLRTYLDDHYGGDRQLAQAALDGARKQWRARATGT
jgi:hypothetical protein